MGELVYLCKNTLAHGVSHFFQVLKTLLNKKQIYQIRDNIN